MTSATELPKFEKPPVIEVVCGIQFEPLTSLLAPHLGVLWERYKQDYPHCREVAPLAPVLERFEGLPSVELQLSDTPPLPRTWFIHQDETGIVQVQRDRFLHNWKKVRDEDEYPHYEKVIGMFRDRLVRNHRRTSFSAVTAPWAMISKIRPAETSARTARMR